MARRSRRSEDEQASHPFPPGDPEPKDEDDDDENEDGTPAASKISVKDIKQRLEDGRKPLRGAALNYHMNEAYLFGEQWLTHNTSSNRIEAIPEDDDRVQATMNHMWPASRTTVAKTVQQPLQFYVPASAADDSTVKGAKTAESILIDLHREHDWEGIREDFIWAAWKGGTAALAINWDPEAGEPLGMTDTRRQYGTGDVCEDVYAIHEFVVEPGVRDAEHARWWITCVGIPPETVKEQWDLEEVPPADAAGMSSVFDRKIVNTINGGDVEVPLTQVTTLYERPNGNCPKGRIVTVVNDRVVDEVDWPFPFKHRLNMVIIRETRRDGTWIGETILKAARPIQRAINQSWSSILEHMKLAGNARFVLPEEMQDQAEGLTDTPGEILYTPKGATGSPGFLSPPQMPSWWIDEPDRLKSEMDDVLGVHEVSRGDAPGRVESGLAISILVEQDTTPAGRFTKETAGAFGRYATMALQLYEKNVKERRKAIVKTPGQPPRNHQWTGKDLRGQVVAEVPLDAVTPRNKAADEANANNALQMGLIDVKAPDALAQWYKLAHLPMDADILEAMSPDIARARRENGNMALGSVCVPMDIDDHVTHIMEHHTYMKSEDYELLDEAERELFIKHNKAHEVLAAEAMGRQRAKETVDPALMASASASGDPLLPMQALPVGAPPVGGAPPPAPAIPPVDPLALQIATANPGVDPGIIANEVGPLPPAMTGGPF